MVGVVSTKSSTDSVFEKTVVGLEADTRVVVDTVVAVRVFTLSITDFLSIGLFVTTVDEVKIDSVVIVG